MTRPIKCWPYCQLKAMMRGHMTFTLVGHYASWDGSWLPTFWDTYWSNLQGSSSSTVVLSWRVPKCWVPTTILYHITSQKIEGLNYTMAEAWNLTWDSMSQHMQWYLLTAREIERKECHQKWKLLKTSWYMQPVCRPVTCASTLQPWDRHVFIQTTDIDL
jgi:hypothetical protein